MQIDRRTILTGLAATMATGLPRRALAQTSLSLGAAEIVSLSDGHLVMPGAFFFQGLPQAEVEAILARHNVPTDQLEPPCNVTLLRDGERVVLFDAGAGPGFMPTAGALPESLDTIGVAPDEITHVVFTHAHPDHLWGVLDDFDEPVFANAEFLMGQTEWDYWRDPATVDSIGQDRAAFAVGAARRLEAIEERCSFFTDGQEILPGVLAQATNGHTPGHMSFEVRSGGDAVVIVGDAIGNAHVAFERPDWPSGADQDTEMGAATRQRLLDRLAQDRAVMIGFHLPEGGIGRVERQDGHFRFVTEDI